MLKFNVKAMAFWGHFLLLIICHCYLKMALLQLKGISFILSNALQNDYCAFEIAGKLAAVNQIA